MKAMAMMRAEDEIVKAHDALVGIIVDQAIRDALELTDYTLDCFMGYARVLCWVLHHDHNRSFADMLERLATDLDRLGIQLREGPPLQ